jgi:hypothetical protein
MQIHSIILGSLHFFMYISDQTQHMNTTTPVLFACDSSVIIAEPYVCRVVELSNDIVTVINTLYPTA